MDSKRFDNWTRNRARRLSRRDALRLAGAGGASAVLAAHAPDTLAQPTCTLAVHGETIGGPSSPATYDGTLQFTIGQDGALTQASFTPAGGAPAPASGSLTGRAIDFELTLPGNQVIAFAGAGDQPIAICQGIAAGLFSGPQPGDIGGWQSTASSSGLSSAPSSGGGQSTAGSGATSGSGGNTGGSGSTGCPNGTEQCGNNCVPSCSGGQSLDLDTCTCPPPEPACIQNQQTCQNHGQCCSGYCGGGTCFDCAGIVCGDFGCVDPSKDSQNCGSCGTVCVYPRVCAGGVCGCAPDDTPCVDHSECCSQYCDVFGTCTTCSNVTSSDGTPYTFCAAGSCVDLRIDINNCGACGRVCQGQSGGLVCVTGNCHDINNDADYCGFSGQPCAPGQICHFGDCINA